MSASFLIVRGSDGLVVNAIKYDDTNPYDPGDNFTLYRWDDAARPWIGWTRNPDGTWTAPPPEPAADAPPA